MTPKVLCGAGYYHHGLLRTSDGRPILIDIDSIPSATGIGATHNAQVVNSDYPDFGAGPSYSASLDTVHSSGNKKLYWHDGTSIATEKIGPPPFYTTRTLTWSLYYLSLEHSMTSTSATLWWEIVLLLQSSQIRATKALTESDPSPFGSYGNISWYPTSSIFNCPTAVTVVRP